MPANRPPALARPGDRLHPEIKRVIEALASAAVRREDRRARESAVVASEGLQPLDHDRQ
jgi:hypothetical protein